MLHVGQSVASAQDTIGQTIVAVTVEQEGRTVTDPLVHELIATTVGEPLSMADVRETIGHLINLRRFEDIQPIAEPAAGGVRLRYVLVPLHPIDRVEFTGTLGVSEGDLRRVITERFGRAPAAGRAAEAVDLLQRTYRSRGYPAAKISTRIEEQHNPERATLIFNVEAGRRARIADIRIDQLDEDVEEAITGTPDIRVGDWYDSATVERELREWEERFKSRGYYEARASFAADIAEDAYLRVSIRRGPLVVVEFAGDPLPEEERERLVPVRAEGSADEDLLEDARINIEQYLHERGYRDAAAPYTRTETPGQLTITFMVTRGPRFVVDRITVMGNAALSAAEIRDILDIGDGDPFVRSVLAARTEDVLNVYRSRGYIRAEVVASDSLLPATPGADRRVEITMTIVEGPRVLVNALSFAGNMALSEAELRSLVTVMPGAVFSPVDVVNSRDRLELEYQNRGYESAKVDTVVTPIEEGAAVDVRYTIVEGPQSIIDHIMIVGNERTSRDTITDELLFREGEPLGYSALINSRARLGALGLFRRVDIQSLPHVGESRRDVLVQVEEADFTSLDIGGGLEGMFRLRRGADGAVEERLELAPRGFFGIGRRNLWGRNRAINLSTRVSFRSTDVVTDPVDPRDGLDVGSDSFNEYRVVATFREPRLLSTRTDLLVTGIVEQAVRTSFNFSRRIVRAETGRRLTPAVSFTAAYSFERTKTFNVDRASEETPLLIDRLFPQVRISKFAGSLLRDTRDDPLDASRGLFVIVDGDLAGRAMGSEVGFARVSAQASSYHRLPISRRVVLALSGRLGTARGFSREVPRLDDEGQPLLGADGNPVFDVVQDLPASERFFAGGDTTVRGFSLDRLGTPETISETGFPLGGNGMVVLNSELRVSVGGSWQAVGFFDAGNVFRRVSDIDLTELRPAAGFGVRYQQFGTIRLDWGFNLDRRELTPGVLERGSVLHVSLGHAF